MAFRAFYVEIKYGRIIDLKEITYQNVEFEIKHGRPHKIIICFLLYRVKI